MRPALTIASHRTISGGGSAFTDDFNRADSTAVGSGGVGLGSGWGGSDGWIISSNTATKSSGSDFTTFKTDVGSPDMWAEALVAPNSGFGVVNVRHPTGTDTDNSYLGFWDPAGFYSLGKVVGGGYTGLATGTSASGITSVTIRVEAQGTAVRLYANGTLVASTTDASLSGNYGGLNAGSGPVFDNFRCGPLPWTP